MTKNYVNLTEASELDDDRLSAANAIGYWRDIKPAERETFADDLGYALDTINKYQARLCTLLGITMQQEPAITLLTGILVIRESVLGTTWKDIPGITLHYYDPVSYAPYKLWMKQDHTILGIEAYSTQDLIARMHDAYCVMQMFGEGRPFI